jgi:hypothetical protein
MSESDSDSSSEAEMDEVLLTVAAVATAAVSSQIAYNMAAADAVPKACTARRAAERRHRAVWAETPWMRMLYDQADQLQRPRSRAAVMFRGDFRLPYPVFLQVVEAARRHKWLQCHNTDAVGALAAPLELKVLAVLYLLGSGCALRTVASLSGMSQSTVQRTFHEFCHDFAADMYEEWVTPQADETTFRPLMQHYAAVGFPGAVGSSDVTHIPWDKTPSRSARAYTGKEGFPTVAYEATVDHTMRVLAVTTGFQGAVNDKTIVRYDSFVQRIKSDPFYTQLQYSVRTDVGNQVNCFKRLTGAYLIVDGGYHKVMCCSLFAYTLIIACASWIVRTSTYRMLVLLQWRCLQCPMKVAGDALELQWSKALESVRKDVECFFGILKGRFRVLKLPVQYRSKESIDDVFYTCCILHNIIHAFDGRDEWEVDVDWGGVDGRLDASLCDDADANYAAAAAARLRAASAAVTGTEEEVESSFYSLRKHLVRHYDSAKRASELHWLRSATAPL